MKEILVKGLSVLMDDDIFPYVLQCHIAKVGYPVIGVRIDGFPNITQVYLHRFVMDFPTNGLTVDHINRNKLDNRRLNLRVATLSQNNSNSATDKANSSGFKGICFDKRTRLWKMQIRSMDNGKYEYFSNPTDAAKAYDSEAINIWGEFAWTNFPRENYVQIKPKKRIVNRKSLIISSEDE